MATMLMVQTKEGPHTYVGAGRDDAWVEQPGAGEEEVAKDQQEGHRGQHVSLAGLRHARRLQVWEAAMNHTQN